MIPADDAAEVVEKISRVFDIKKKSQVKNRFTVVAETDMRACFNRSIWGPAMNMQQLALGTSHLILGDNLVRVLQSLGAA